MDLRNFRLVTSNIGASAVPLTARGIGEIRQKGFKTVISLIPRDELESVGITSSQFLYLLKKNKLRWIRIPVSDLGVPTGRQFKQFCDAVKTAEKRKERVLVHCLNGNGRVGTMIGGYLIRQKGFFLEDAVRCVLRGNLQQETGVMRFPESPEQEKFLIGLEARRIANRLPAKARPQLYVIRKTMAELLAKKTFPVPSTREIAMLQKLLARGRKPNQRPLPSRPKLKNRGGARRKTRP